MKTHVPWGATFASLFVLSACGSPGAVEPVADTPALSAELAISGPFQHQNLRVWLIQGPDQLVSTRRVVPLEEALEQELVVVHETGDVNELAIENVALDVDVYVQSGDIVQGGKQDRAIAIDLVLAPGSGRVPLSSYCVERGRWSARGAAASGGVIAELFSWSSNSVPTPELKKAILLDNDQDKVWEEVARTKSALRQTLSAGPSYAMFAASTTSLELVMNAEAVQQATASYCEALTEIVDRHDDTIGVAFAIGGELQGGDVYGSRQLFRQLWPKLLRAAATAAVAADSEAVTSPDVTVDDVRRMVAAPSPQQFGDTNGPVRMGIVENATGHTVESRVGSALLHRTYLPK